MARTTSRYSAASKVLSREELSRGSKRIFGGVGLLALLVGGGCTGPSDVDLEGPRVVQVTPAGPVIETSASFVVVFSEPIASRRVTLESGHVALAERINVDDGFLSDIANPPLTDSRQGDVLPFTLTWSDDELSLTVTPSLTLRAATGYALVISEDVRDGSGNPLAALTGSTGNFVYEVATDAGPPVVVSTTATGIVPPNIKRLRVTFNQSVQGVSRETIQLAPAAGGDIPSLEAIEVSADRSQAEIILADGADCERLIAGVEYRLSIETGIEDDAGRAMPAQDFLFTAGGACDLVPNQVTSLDAFAYDNTAIVLFSTSKASTTELRFGSDFSTLDCGGASCPVLGQPARVVADGRFLHEVQAEGLTLGQNYAYSVYAEDDFGNRATGQGTFAVVALPPIAINELLPNPAGEEAAGEFIELVNFGETESIDLAGWQIQIEDKTPCFFGATAPVIEPGGFLVVARGSFNETAWPQLNADQVYRADADDDCTASALTLSNTVQTVRLLDDGGRPVSAYPGSPELNPTTSREGQSIERVTPDAPDVAMSFCFADGPPTPGSTNSAVISGCQ